MHPLVSRIRGRQGNRPHLMNGDEWWGVLGGKVGGRIRAPVWKASSISLRVGRARRCRRVDLAGRACRRKGEGCPHDVFAGARYLGFQRLIPAELPFKLYLPEGPKP